MDMTRRRFIEASAVAGGALYADVAAAAPRQLPRRVLGRTRARVSVLGFGSAALGHSFQPQEVFDHVVGAALDAGVNFIDTATNYDVAQERLGPIVRRHRDRLFLATKTRGMSKQGVLQTLEESLRLLQTDRLDLVYLHNLGDFEVDRLMDDNGAMQGLLEARRRGWLRFIGASGHQRARKFIPVIETDLIDVIMVTLNFVDRNTYVFESEVLPAARRRRVGIVAMKVLGGVPNWNYRQPVDGMVPRELRADAVRYSLAIEGVASAVVGFYTTEQMSEVLNVMRALRRPTDSETERLRTEGERLAALWGPHLGPPV
ncbi:MAG TPA: aldo/keto reductase [Chthonomonadales bacterium]|nr:aldo/keto reductase [Chthonomonadales bacterium]